MKSTIYIGTGGYSDTDLIGTLYPHGAKASEFLHHYANHYDCVEINSSFHAPIGIKTVQGMINKANGRLKFSLKLHQTFSHTCTATAKTAQDFLGILTPFGEYLAPLLLQFPHSFERTTANRHYLGEVVKWFEGWQLAIEFRHPSWHITPVFTHFAKTPNLIWVNADYPKNIGLPNTSFWANTRTAYYRLHGRRGDWWEKESAKERHDYRYTDAELAKIADEIFSHRANFDELFIYFQNTTNAHSFYNIMILKEKLSAYGFVVKTPKIVGQGELFDD
ncbi:DUF72 domain-containing protein [Moraxella nasicaprae]|uniref:DUF72 domain-containing protein n=1 Tax=Moraxella nasicaprae TaxID=2904122 RepID=A0ABY6F2M0_9GAMM|nr:DUF72 domain-containing protein [Moraxella nasicaprae]UXZ04341.1 DUF72 domain-containing protein [Moraxella nasicaprae]